MEGEEAFFKKSSSPSSGSVAPNLGDVLCEQTPRW